MTPAFVGFGDIATVTLSLSNMDSNTRNPTVAAISGATDSSDTGGRPQNVKRKPWNDASRTADVGGGKRSRRSKNGCVFDVATWNVRGMYATGEAEVVRREAERQKISVLRVAEVRWP